VNSTLSALPVNYSPVIVGEQEIFDDAEYAFRVAESYLACISGGVEAIHGKNVLEIGPGINLGALLILKCLGARIVCAADRFLCRFQSGYHVPLYSRIKALLPNKFPGADSFALDRCIQGESHCEEVILCKECALEELADELPSEFDLTFSNAVFEHLYLPFQAFLALHRLMADGGCGYHQVDFRDHRHFDRPLEYLLHDEFTFNDLLHRCNAECGNRLRPHEMHAMFSAAGFRRISFVANMWAESEYLQKFVPRLRRCTVTPYAFMDVGLLQEISGRFHLEK
jgi:hypothetical protein